MTLYPVQFISLGDPPISDWSSYLEYRVLHLFSLAWFPGPGWSGTKLLQLAFAGLDATFELWDVVPRISVLPIEHLPYADQDVSLAFQVLEDTVRPGSGLVL